MQQRRYLEKDLDQQTAGTKKRRLQKKMRGQIDSTRDEEIKAKKRKERNKILNEIKEPNKEEKRKGHKERIRRNRIQTHWCHQVFWGSASIKEEETKKVIVYNENGDMVNTENELEDEITNFFREIFEKGTTKEFPPCSMKTLFREEISIATKKLRNGENPDIDSMNA